MSASNGFSPDVRADSDAATADSIRDLTFTIDVWDDRDNLIEHIGKISNLTVARAAFEAAVLERPGKEITIRQGIRVVRTTKAVGTGRPS